MGNKLPLITPSCSCEYCGIPTKDAVKNNDGISVCKRCGAPVLIDKPEKKPKHTKSPSGEAYNAIGGGEEKLLLETVRLPIQRLMVRPFAESLPEEWKAMSDSQIIESYLVPYFSKDRHEVTKGARFQIKEVDFKVFYCYPPIGVTTPDTKYGIGKPIHALVQIKKLHILPTLASLHETKYDSNQIFEHIIKPYFNTSEPRHVVNGETFISKGIEFKIVACEPESGQVVKSTEIFTDGKPIEDLKKVHLLPIYETLPNREKKISPKEIFERYLTPFFCGRSYLLNRGDEVQIDGVDFKVVACEPDHGMVTLETEIFAEGEPLRADELKRQQLREDEEIARSLQRDEARMQWPFDGREAIIRINSTEEVRMRLQELLRLMPPNDRRRPLLLHVYQQISHPSADRNILSFLRAAQMENEGAHKRDIESLPTRIYQGKKPPTNDAKTESKEHTSCMVCLSEYEKGEELRTLPCFHSYHKDCIDTWLVRNKKCPVCKNPVC